MDENSKFVSTKQNFRTMRNVWQIENRNLKYSFYSWEMNMCGWNATKSGKEKYCNTKPIHVMFSIPHFAVMHTSTSPSYDSLPLHSHVTPQTLLSLVSCYTNPRVNFIHQITAVWLRCVELHDQCSSTSSASARSWQLTHKHCFFAKTASLAHNTCRYQWLLWKRGWLTQWRASLVLHKVHRKYLPPVTRPKHCLPWKADSLSDHQGIPACMAPKMHYRFHRSRPLGTTNIL
jgi:hypothetical protein